MRVCVCVCVRVCAFPREIAVYATAFCGNVTTPYTGRISLKTVISSKTLNFFNLRGERLFSHFPITVIIHLKPRRVCVRTTCMCVFRRQKERANSRHLLVIVVFWISPLPPSSPLLSSPLLSSPLCCLFPVTGEVAAPGDPWPPAGHLGRYAGRWGLCWRAARTRRKPVLIRWREENRGGRTYCLSWWVQTLEGGKKNSLDHFDLSYTVKIKANCKEGLKLNA